MNKMLKQGSFLSQGPATYQSRFEMPEMDFSGAGPMCAQFGSRLRRVFELPCPESQPDRFQILLNQIEEKLGSKL
ncbi:conserved hypothetical protein [Methylocella tundrae]|uniref:Uncharacterized protein n=1 Tax=Methylocella tundrae TaxID=227605 RepID=A0A8B6M415_METTU|nr:hypothetical protein [Methylocella tundrae]VTZ49578.1 conserved hypothetical protein [Methylocella tundrae]